MSFASDNYAGVHPSVIKAIEEANKIGHVGSYGRDQITEEAVAKFQGVFGSETKVFFVWNGTAANVLCFKTMCKSYEAIICASCSHINVDECGAPENYTGSKVINVPSKDGKLSIHDIEQCLFDLGDYHRAQPKVVSITNPTEYGTVYTAQEIRELADFVHSKQMYLHMDGARISNAAASLGTSLREITVDAGLDALSFGGTKIGLLGTEAVLFFNPSLGEDFRFIRKQGMQLASKMRFVSCQYLALLENDLWRVNATHANAMAKLLESLLIDCPNLTITQKVQTCSVFAILPPKLIPELQKSYHFYLWDPKIHEVRLMCSWDTKEEDVRNFATLVRKTLSQGEK